MSMSHVLHYPLKNTSFTSPEFLLLKHMLATPLTNIQLCVQDSAVSKAHSKARAVAVAENLNISLKRINDIFHFFADQQRVSCQKFSIKTIVTALTQYFPNSQDLVTVQWLTTKPTDRAALFLRGNLFLLDEALLCLIKNGLESYTLDEERHVTVTIWQRKKELCIAVRDYGVGIAYWKKLLCQLPFISFKKSGSGVGLSFAHYVVAELYAGKVSIHSLENLGTEVICRLPLEK